MKVQIEVIEGVVVITPQVSYMDSSNATGLNQKAQYVVKGAASVILNMHEVKMIDSRGLQAVLQLVFQVRSQGGEICVTNLAPQVNMMVDYLSVDTVVHKFSDGDQAIEHMTQKLAA